MNGGDSADGEHRSVSRRQFVKAAGATGAAAGTAGCMSVHPLSFGDDQEGRTTVRFAGDSDVADAADTVRQALWDAGLDQDIYVEIIAGATQTGARQSQYTRWLSADLPEPDLLLMDSGWALAFIQRGQLMNLEEELPQPLVQQVKNEYFQASVTTAQSVDGDLHAVPMFPDFPTIQYRKDLVKEAGYDPDGTNWATESMDWKRFSQVTKDVMQQSDEIRDGYGFTFQADVYEGLSCCDFNEFMTSFGGAYFGGLDNLFGPIGERPVTVAEDPVVQSVEMIRTFIQGTSGSLEGYAQDIAPPGVLQWTEEPSRRPFTSGNAVMHRNWPYSIRINGAEDVFGEDLGVMPIPYGVPASEAKYEGTGGPVAALGGWHLTVNPNTEEKEATLKVIEAMMQRSFKLKLLETLGWLPPEPQLLDSEAVQNIPIIGRYIPSLKVAGQNAVPRPVTAVWPLESTKIAQSVHSTYDGSQPPQQAMQALQKDLTMIENYNEGN